MKTSSLLRYAAIGMASVGVGLGVAAADSASIEETGPDSTNRVEINNNQSVSVNNNHSVFVNNSNDQSASTGSANVEDNTTGGDATSGDAENENETETSVSFGNGGSWDLDGFFGGETDASIENTGPDSTNRIEVNNNQSLTVNNNQSVTVINSNSQSASTGSADVEHNTTGGDATSGSASNSNSTSTTIEF